MQTSGQHWSLAKLGTLPSVLRNCLFSAVLPREGNPWGVPVGTGKEARVNALSASTDKRILYSGLRFSWGHCAMWAEQTQSCCSTSSRCGTRYQVRTQQLPVEKCWVSLSQFVIESKGEGQSGSTQPNRGSWSVGKANPVRKADRTTR